MSAARKLVTELVAGDRIVPRGATSPETVIRATASERSVCVVVRTNASVRVYAPDQTVPLNNLDPEDAYAQSLGFRDFAEYDEAEREFWADHQLSCLHDEDLR